MDTQVVTRSCRGMKVFFVLAVSGAIPAIGFGQTPEPLGVMGKFKLHAKSTYSPVSVLGTAAIAGFREATDTPEEWGQGVKGYGARFGSALARSGIHSALAFGLDSTLHQDPRYFRSTSTGFLRRAAHALRGTILTRTDSGGETLSTWRFGSAYGAAFLSNQWYPDRVNTVAMGFTQGSTTIALDLARNLGKEFWPDIKRKLQRKK